MLSCWQEAQEALTREVILEQRFEGGKEVASMVLGEEGARQHYSVLQHARMAKRSALGSGVSETRERGNGIREGVRAEQSRAFWFRLGLTLLQVRWGHQSLRPKVDMI